MKRRKRTDPNLFEGIRKPIAPPTKKLGDDRPEEKVHPAQRKLKHKKKNEADGDL